MMKGIGEKVHLWIVAVRLYSITASVLPVVLGSAYAWYVTGQFHGGLFTLALLAGVFYHVACNLTNDYYDYKYGLDRPGTYGGSGVLVNGSMSPQTMLKGTIVLFVLGTLIGLYLVWKCGLIILWLGIIGLLASIFYTASKLSAKMNAWGELLVFLMMGVAMTVGGYAVQTGTASWSVVWISLPLSFLVMAILTANNIRDLADDRASHIRTIPILLGGQSSRAFFDVILFAAYPLSLILVLMKLAPWPVLLVFITFPMAIKLHRLFRSHRVDKHEELKDTPAETAKLHLAFNVLMSVGILAGRWIG
jgi:1,4-dihydroxy-2-naphthoate octaprenyltransferase